MAKINAISSRMIFDSRGFPTLETTLQLDTGITVSSSVPNGVSVGSYESMRLRDIEDPAWNGKGMRRAVHTIQTIIAPKLVGMDVTMQQQIDKTMIELDGTSKKEKLGSNSILSISQAVAKAAAISLGLPLYTYVGSLAGITNITIPTPIFTIWEGGKHAVGGINFQDLLIIPAVSKTFEDKMHVGIAVYNALKSFLIEKSKSVAVADEGGFMPEITNNVEALNWIKHASDKSSYKFSLDFFLGLDCAAQSFCFDKKYKLSDYVSSLGSVELAEFYTTLFNEYALLYFEDPFADDDIEGWRNVSQSLAGKTLIAGDDLISSSPYRMQVAMDKNLVNSVVISPIQIGTVTEAIAAAAMARYKKYKIIISSRAGETNDTFICDFALGVGADYIKFGAPVHEGAFKYNRILNIAGEVN